jgi:subtilisin family serine protease
MKKLLALLIVAAIFLSGIASVSASRTVRVYVKPGSEKIVEKLGGKILHKFDDVVSVEIPEFQKPLLKLIGAYEEDVPVFRILGDCDYPWGIYRINADKAWETTKGSGSKIAILDTGIATNSQEFSGRIKLCVSFVGTVDCEDDNGHGTHVAGTAASSNYGVAPEAEIYAIKVCDSQGYCYDDAIRQGIIAARKGPDGTIGTEDDATVISMSFGGDSGLSRNTYKELQNAYNQGIVLVAAAGNDGPYANSIDYPAAYAEVISVAALDSSDNVPYWSSRGSSSSTCKSNPASSKCLEVAAPGVNILSVTPSGKECWSGTSMATPHVSGTVALIKSKNRSLSPIQVRQILWNTAYDIQAGHGYYTANGYDIATGKGLIQADKAVSIA